jgi:16S rRNA (adenine1518-N6/adenine1519-N6)-dimethyltransferase
VASRRRAALGQHFLTDRNYVARIVASAALTEADVVLEVGPGHGALTGPMLATGAAVVAVETDRALVAELTARLGSTGRLRLHHADAVKAPLAAWGPYTKLVANLPYRVSTPLTFRFLDLAFEEAVLMYQREFADRMAARPGTSAYGRLTASVAYHASVETLFHVPPGAFSPPPRVGSSVVRLRPHSSPPFPVSGVDAYRELLRVAFTNRRKTMRAIMRAQHAAVGVASAEQAVGVIESMDWADRRPETLSPSDFGSLTLALAEGADG